MPSISSTLTPAEHMHRDGEGTDKNRAETESLILDTLHARLHQAVLLLEWSVANRHDGELFQPAQNAVEAALRDVETVRK